MVVLLQQQQPHRLGTELKFSDNDYGLALIYSGFYDREKAWIFGLTFADIGCSECDVKILSDIKHIRVMTKIPRKRLYADPFRQTEFEFFKHVEEKIEPEDVELFLIDQMERIRETYTITKPFLLGLALDNFVRNFDAKSLRREYRLFCLNELWIRWNYHVHDADQIRFYRRKVPHRLSDMLLEFNRDPDTLELQYPKNRLEAMVYVFKEIRAAVNEKECFDSEDGVP